MMKKVHSLLLPLLALTAGCIKEDPQACYSGLDLRFHYTLNPLDENMFGPEINELDIHVFDSEGVFYEEFIFDDPAHLVNEHPIHLPLPDGRWNIVAWGSTEKGSLESSYGMGTVDIAPSKYTYHYGIVKGETSLEESRLWVKNHEEGENGRRVVSDDLSRLYHASIYDIETVTSAKPATVVDVPMMQNTNTLRVIINGLPPLDTRAANDELAVSADMVNGRYRHNNLICQDALPLKYRNGNWEANDTGVQYDLTVLRPFVDDDDSELILSGPIFERA